jgi:hypothetical protein
MIGLREGYRLPGNWKTTTSQKRNLKSLKKALKFYILTPIRNRLNQNHKVAQNRRAMFHYMVTHVTRIYSKTRQCKLSSNDFSVTCWNLIGK